MDWGTRTGKPVDAVLSELASALGIARKVGGYEIGVLTHHLVHDEAAWAACEALAAIEGVEWVGFPGQTSAQHDHAPGAGNR
jgi:hypothetical protein